MILININFFKTEIPKAFLMIVINYYYFNECLDFLFRLATNTTSLFQVFYIVGVPCSSFISGSVIKECINITRVIFVCKQHDWFGFGSLFIETDLFLCMKPGKFE